jgi:hypothetical protein
MNRPVASMSSSSSVSYREVAAKATALELLYAENKVPIPPGCDLAKHIQDAKKTEELWNARREREISAGALYRGVQMIRIADAFASVVDAAARESFLRDMLNGSLDVFDRVRSKAKDTLWEMDLCALLREHSFDAHFGEPDIVAKLSGSNVGIACKKIYSHKGVRKVLSEAVRQIERAHEIGFFALNIDELLVKNHIRVASSELALKNSYNNDNLNFLKLHERFFRKYLQTGRSLCAFIASGGIAHINDTPHTARQFTVWAIPTADVGRKQIIDEIQRRFMT